MAKVSGHYQQLADDTALDLRDLERALKRMRSRRKIPVEDRERAIQHIGDTIIPIRHELLKYLRELEEKHSESENIPA